MRHLYALLLLGVMGNGSCGGSPQNGEAYERTRAQLSAELRQEGIRDPRVLDAIGRVARHRFIPLSLQYAAYDNRALPIGEGQTISQPYVVAFMTEALQLCDAAKVLEIGTGSGYQAAILAEIAGQVYSVEIVPALARRASALLASLGYANVHVKVGDGYAGWPEEGPFDGIIVTAALPEVPRPLIEQLKPGGTLIAPVGERDRLQQLLRLTKKPDGSLQREALLPVVFVPMTGEVRRPPG